MLTGACTLLTSTSWVALRHKGCALSSCRGIRTTPGANLCARKELGLCRYSSRSSKDRDSERTSVTECAYYVSMLPAGWWEMHWTFPGSGFKPTNGEMLGLMCCIYAHDKIWEKILQAYGVFGMGGKSALSVWVVTLVLAIAGAGMLLWYWSRRTQVVPGILSVS
jgi:hypothetical protein